MRRRKSEKALLSSLWLESEEPRLRRGRREEKRREEKRKRRGREEEEKRKRRGRRGGNTWLGVIVAPGVFLMRLVYTLKSEFLLASRRTQQRFLLSWSTILAPSFLTCQFAGRTWIRRWPETRSEPTADRCGLRAAAAGFARLRATIQVPAGCVCCARGRFQS